MIHICQYLCPERHCVVAMAYDPEGRSKEQIEAMLKEPFELGLINPWCGLCKSRDLHFEHARSKYKTMEEAQEPLRETELENLISRLAIESVRRQARNN